MQKILVEWHLDYVNNFLSLEHFADSNGIDTKQALVIINLGKALNESEK